MDNNFEIYKNGYKKDLVKFGEEYKDVCRIFTCKDSNDKLNFIIYVDDTCNDSVLDYNEFGFNLLEKYSILYDFIVLDMEHIEFIDYYFNDVKVIYERK